MNHQQLKKIEFFVVICLLLVGFLTFFPSGGITGHLSSDLNTQKIDIDVDSSQVFELSSDSNSFTITSLRLSGLIKGEGIAEIYLDNGNGQELLVFNNIRDKPTGGGLTGITAKVIAGPEMEFEEVNAEKELVINHVENIDKAPISTVNKGQETFNRAFESECIETCFIEMDMEPHLGYNLVFRMDKGTSIHLTKLQYTIKEE